MSPVFDVSRLSEKPLNNRRRTITKSSAPRQDVYTRVTDKIIADLEEGVRPGMKPWNAEPAAVRITRPLRNNGQPYKGINILMLWFAAVTQGYSVPIWMTFRQAKELGANVRKGEKGELVVYANTITRTETDAETGEEAQRAIPFMKGYRVFNVEQIEGLPAHFYQLAQLDGVDGHGVGACQIAPSVYKTSDRYAATIRVQHTPYDARRAHAARDGEAPLVRQLEVRRGLSGKGQSELRRKIEGLLPVTHFIHAVLGIHIINDEALETGGMEKSNLL